MALWIWLEYAKKLLGVDWLDWLNLAVTVMHINRSKSYSNYLYGKVECFAHFHILHNVWFAQIWYMTSSQRILPLTVAHIKAGTALYCLVSITTRVCIRLDDMCDSFSQVAKGMLVWYGLVTWGPWSIGISRGHLLWLWPTCLWWMEV